MFNREHTYTNIRYLYPFQRTLPSFEELVTSILRPKDFTQSCNGSLQPISKKNISLVSFSTGSRIVPIEIDSTYNHSSSIMRMALIGYDKVQHSSNNAPPDLQRQPIDIQTSYPVHTGQIPPIQYFTQELSQDGHNNTIIRSNAFDQIKSLTSPHPNRSLSKSHGNDKRNSTCSICHRSFTTSGHMARHNRIHTGERKHLCPWPGCAARFSRQDNCMQHYKTHKNRKRRPKNSSRGNYRTVDK